MVRRAASSSTTGRRSALFPSGAGPGITGELVWLRVPRARLGVPDEVDVIAEDALRRGGRCSISTRGISTVCARSDVDAVLATLHDGVASAVRDYVDDTGTLVELTGRSAHRSWYQALFEKYEIQSVQPLCQVIEDWYVFAELRVTAAPRNGTGAVAFHTAEFHIPAKDGRFIARIGHGTEPV